MVRRGSQTLGFIIAFTAWLLLTWSLEPGSIVIGIISSLLASMFFGELLTVTPERALHPGRYLWFIYFIPVFLWEMVKANIDVAYRVLHPKLPINPGLIKIRTGLKSEVSKALLCNALSLTPGSTTVDIIDDEIYVHCIDIDNPVEAKARRFEKIIERVLE